MNTFVVMEWSVLILRMVVSKKWRVQKVKFAKNAVVILALSGVPSRVIAEVAIDHSAAQEVRVMRSQRCHLNYDRDHHIEVQRRNREAKRRQVQPALLEVRR